MNSDTLRPEPAPSRHTPPRETFRQLVERAREASGDKTVVVPVWRDTLADMETPVSAFRRIAHRPNAFLLESVEGGENLGRYSFLGADPRMTFRSKGRAVIVTENGVPRAETLPTDADPLTILERYLAGIHYVALPDLPRFVGGAVGYIGYDWVRFLEPVGDDTEDDLGVDDVHLLFADTLAIFDHVRHRLKALANASVTPGQDIDAAYNDATARADGLLATLVSTPPDPSWAAEGGGAGSRGAFTSNMTPDAYRNMVLASKEYIAAGDVFQVVVAQRFSKPVTADPFDVYRALRSLNPSPYMYYLALDSGVTLVGASPEILCTVEGGKVTVRPIAGTRPRGKTPEEDAALAAELLSDEKERAEHIMLVDLGRNDVGRVAKYGSVHVDELMVIEKYSHVMHIVSNVSGELLDDKTPFDVLRATFPAGTLSGAPKVRAMQIIEELEPTRRGTYGGAIGYFSLNGNLDAAITIRTVLIKNGVAHVQAGGGIVADSDPDAEYLETVKKSEAGRRAVEIAERGLDTLFQPAGVTAGSVGDRWNRLEIEAVRDTPVVNRRG